MDYKTKYLKYKYKYNQLKGGFRDVNPVNTNKLSNDEKSFHIIPRIVSLKKEKVEFGRFEFPLTGPTAEKNENQKYIGNIQLDDYLIAHPERVEIKRSDLLNNSLIDLVNLVLPSPITNDGENYLFLDRRFCIIMDPCKYYEKPKFYKRWCMYSDNMNLTRVRNREPERKDDEDLYGWIGQNNSGSEIEEVNIYFVLLPIPPDSMSDYFTAFSAGQKSDYIQNISKRFMQVYPDISQEEL
jgi:hypothetical protein